MVWTKPFSTRGFNAWWITKLRNDVFTLQEHRSASITPVSALISQIRSLWTKNNLALPYRIILNDPPYYQVAVAGSYELLVHDWNWLEANLLDKLMQMNKDERIPFLMYYFTKKAMEEEEHRQNSQGAADSKKQLSKTSSANGKDKKDKPTNRISVHNVDTTPLTPPPTNNVPANPGHTVITEHDMQQAAAKKNEKHEKQINLAVADPVHHKSNNLSATRDMKKSKSYESKPPPPEIEEEAEEEEEENKEKDEVLEKQKKDPQFRQLFLVQQKSLIDMDLLPAETANADGDKGANVSPTAEEDEDKAEEGDGVPDPNGAEQANQLIDEQHKRLEQLTQRFEEKQQLEHGTMFESGDIKCFEMIGRGSYAEVYRATWKSINIAVKKMKADLNEREVKFFLEEAKMMSRFNHPNVVRFIGACMTKPDLFIVTELLPRGSLFTLIHLKRVKLGKSKKLFIAQGIAGGLNYLHNLNLPIIHRDLKSSNILLTDKYESKVSDFGLSRIVDTDISHMTANIGTPYWMAPEIIKMQKYTTKVDVFSYGILLYELYSGELPYRGLAPLVVPNLVAEKGLRPTVPKGCPRKMAKLMTMCWDANPDNRPTFAEILEYLK